MKPVLIVEDHPLVAEATGTLLARHHELIELVLCSTATGAVEKLEELGDRWFRIFLDLDVPGAYGLSLVREVQRRNLSDRCCIVSASDRQDYINEVRSNGFLGYILKATQVTEFKTRLLRVLDGEPSFPANTEHPRSAAIRLTGRQSQTLELVRAGLSSKEIAIELHVAEGTVNNHVASILQVLEASNRAEAVAKAIELGILQARSRFDSEPTPHPTSSSH